MSQRALSLSAFNAHSIITHCSTGGTKLLWSRTERSGDLTDGAIDQHDAVEIAGARCRARARVKENARRCQNGTRKLPDRASIFSLAPSAMPRSLRCSWVKSGIAVEHVWFRGNIGNARLRRLDR